MSTIQTQAETFAAATKGANTEKLFDLALEHEGVYSEDGYEEVDSFVFFDGSVARIYRNTGNVETEKPYRSELALDESEKNTVRLFKDGDLSLETEAETIYFKYLSKHIMEGQKSSEMNLLTKIFSSPEKVDLRDKHHERTVKNIVEFLDGHA